MKNKHIEQSPTIAVYNSGEAYLRKTKADRYIPGEYAFLHDAASRAIGVADMLSDYSDRYPDSDVLLEMALQSLDSAGRAKLALESSPAERLAQDKFSKNPDDVVYLDRLAGSENDRLQELLPTYRTNFRNQLTEFVNLGVFPASLLDSRVNLIDSVNVELMHRYYEDYDYYLKGSYSDKDSSMRLNLRGGQDGVGADCTYKTFIHEGLHLIEGRVANPKVLDRMSKGEYIHHEGRGIEHGLYSAGNPFTRWINEAFTEHLAQCMLRKDSETIDKEIYTGDGSYEYERMALAGIVKKLDIDVADLVYAYFEEAAGTRKDRNRRQAGMIARKIVASFKPTLFKRLKSAFDYSNPDSIDKILEEEFIDLSDVVVTDFAEAA